MGAMTDYTGPGLTSLQPPEDITRGLFGRGLNIVRSYPLATDALLAAALLALSTVWLARSPFADVRAAAVQAALVATVAVRRSRPSIVFLVACAIAFCQWLLGFPLLGDGALLIGLYTVAAHEPRIRAVAAAGLLEAGVIMAAVKWAPAGTVPRSLLFLTATVIAALFAGLTVASGSRYLAWMDERARRLAVERDQQTTIAAAAERTRIARELHDIVAHAVSVMVLQVGAVRHKLPDALAEDRDALRSVEQAGRTALAEMRRLLAAMRRDEDDVDMMPQPGLDGLGSLLEEIGRAGLPVRLHVDGEPFPLPAAIDLSAYRIVQEGLTNALKHARASHADVTVRYGSDSLQTEVRDDGIGGASSDGLGHGLVGIRERVKIYGGEMTAGAANGGGFILSTRLPLSGDPR
jgi:signal transduction histidine kinase